jgi:hypothetical protein
VVKDALMLQNTGNNIADEPKGPKDR